MTRLTLIRRRMDALTAMNPDPDARRTALIHLYGVSQACAGLALRRGVDAELAAVAGMLHDIYSCAHGYSPEHARLGAPMAQRLMEELGCFTPEEVAAVCNAIAVHSDKAGKHDPLAEVLIDADVLQHCLYDPAQPPQPAERTRFERLMNGEA